MWKAVEVSSASALLLRRQQDSLENNVVTCTILLFTLLYIGIGSFGCSYTSTFKNGLKQQYTMD